MRKSKCPKCGSKKFVPVLTFGFVCVGYLSRIRCIKCGYIISVEDEENENN